MKFAVTFLMCCLSGVLGNAKPTVISQNVTISNESSSKTDSLFEIGFAFQDNRFNIGKLHSNIRIVNVIEKLGKPQRIIEKPQRFFKNDSTQKDIYLEYGELIFRFYHNKTYKLDILSDVTLKSENILLKYGLQIGISFDEAIKIMGKGYEIVSNKKRKKEILYYGPENEDGFQPNEIHLYFENDILKMIYWEYPSEISE